MKHLTWAFLAAAVLAGPIGCTRNQGEQQEQQGQEQESAVPGEGQGSMGEQPSGQQNQETVLPQDQQQNDQAQPESGK